VRVSTTETGEILPTPEVLTLAAIDSKRQPRRLVFTAPGRAPSFVENHDADVAHLPGVRPIESDANLTHAQRSFAGRDAWTLGIIALHCLPTASKTLLLGGGTRVRIEGIFRVQNVPSFHAIGEQNVWTRASASGFWTVDPLVVVVRVPSDALVVGEITPQTIDPFGGQGGTPPPVGTLVQNVGIVAPPGTEPLPPGRQGVVARESMITGCGVGTNDLSDLWELERTFTTVSPAAYRSWTRSVRRAIAERRIIPGMPREAVAYVNGYPDLYGTVAEMNRLKTWSYDLPTPFNSSVRFNRNGRVVVYQPPSMLPEPSHNPKGAVAELEPPSSPDPTSSETPEPFGCDAPPPLVPLPRSPKMLLPVSGATVSEDLKVIYFDAPPDDSVNLVLDGSNGDSMAGGLLTAPGTVPRGLQARHVSQALVPTDHRRSSDPSVSTSNDPLVPVFTPGVRYRVSFETTTLRCPKRYLGDSGYFTVK